MGKLDDKVVIITGSSAGIGRAIARIFAKEGAFVTIHGRSSESLQINNAGIGGKPGLELTSIENYQYTFDVNLKSILYLTNLSVPYLEQTKGNIVNVSSVAAIRPGLLSPFYHMAKAALDHFGRCYSLILAEKGIRINTINPGIIESEFGIKMGMTENQDSSCRAAMVRDLVPMKRSGTAEEISRTILFLATDATYMTGANIVTDGGFVNFVPTSKME